MNIYLGADHNGFALKEKIAVYLKKHRYDVVDVGDTDLDPDDDAAVFAHKAVDHVLSGNENSRAILICGGGQAMCMAANRFKGIRASVIWDPNEAKMTRNDNDSNVLCLPARVVQSNDALWKDIVDTWLKTPFAEAPRFKRRRAQLDELS